MSYIAQNALNGGGGGVGEGGSCSIYRKHVLTITRIWPPSPAPVECIWCYNTHSRVL